MFVSIALGAIFLGTLISGGTAGALIAGVLLAIANLVISAVYFIWTWTNPDLRASLGQRALGLNTLNAADGATLTRPQAVRRWLFLFGFVAFASAMQSALQTTSLNTIGFLVGLAGVRVRDLPAVDDVQQPEEAGLPRRPGRDRRRQARLTTRRHSNGAGIAGPVFRCPAFR